MNLKDAKKIINDYERKLNPTKSDDVLFVDALKYCIEKTNDSEYITYLGGYYYGKKDFDLALKYYSIASEMNHPYALNGLGYIYYYGRCGNVDYEKAFYYYNRASKLGVDEATIKVSDCYKNGYGVEKDINKSYEILNDLYKEIKNTNLIYSKYPEVAIRLSSKLIDDEEYEEAFNMLYKAKMFIIDRIHYDPFFGEFTNMNRILDNIYKCIYFDKYKMDFYDFIYYFKKPGIAYFKIDNKEYKIIGELENGNIIINFNNKWYKSIIDFFINAKLNNERLTSKSFDIYDCKGE